MFLICGSIEISRYGLLFPLAITGLSRRVFILAVC